MAPSAIEQAYYERKSSGGHREFGIMLPARRESLRPHSPVSLRMGCAPTRCLQARGIPCRGRRRTHTQRRRHKRGGFPEFSSFNLNLAKRIEQPLLAAQLHRGRIAEVLAQQHQTRPMI